MVVLNTPALDEKQSYLISNCCGSEVIGYLRIVVPVVPGYIVAVETNLLSKTISPLTSNG
jgi:hypothetical protein